MNTVNTVKTIEAMYHYFIDTIDPIGSSSYIEGFGKVVKVGEGFDR